MPSALSNDGYAMRLLAESNVDRLDWPKTLTILGAVLQASRSKPSQVLAISQADALVFVLEAGVRQGSLRGVITKKVAVSALLSFDRIKGVVPGADGWKDRREFHLDLVDASAERLLQLKWEGWASDGWITADDARGERDRILRIILGALPES